MVITIQSQEGFSLINLYLNSRFKQHQDLVGSLLVLKGKGTFTIDRIETKLVYGKTIESSIYYSSLSTNSREQSISAHSLFNDGLLHLIRINEGKLLNIVLRCSILDTPSESRKFIKDFLNEELIEKYPSKIISVCENRLEKLSSWPYEIFPVLLNSKIYKDLSPEVKFFILMSVTSHSRHTYSLISYWKNLIAINPTFWYKAPDNIKSHDTILNLVPLEKRYDFLIDKINQHPYDHFLLISKFADIYRKHNNFNDWKRINAQSKTTDVLWELVPKPHKLSCLISILKNEQDPTKIELLIENVLSLYVEVKDDSIWQEIDPVLITKDPLWIYIPEDKKVNCLHALLARGIEISNGIDVKRELIQLVNLGFGNFDDLPHDYWRDPILFPYLSSLTKAKVIEEIFRETLRYRVSNKVNLIDLSSNDLRLVQQWMGNKYSDLKKLTPQIFRDFLSDKKYSKDFEIGRLLSARMAEKAVIHYFSINGFNCSDISLKQVTERKNRDWKTHDISINGRNYDVKNSRRSMNNKKNYTDHYIKKPKTDRFGREVEIIGTLSEYFWPSSLLDPNDIYVKKSDYSYIEILGITSLSELNIIRDFFNEDSLFEIDFSQVYNQLNSDDIMFCLPPWIFNTEKLFNPISKDVKLLVDYELETQVFHELERLNPIATSLFLGKNPVLVQPIEKWQEMFCQMVMCWRLEREPILPFIYLTVLKHFLIIAKDSENYPTFTPSQYKPLVFNNSGTKFPLMTFDPLETVSNLIDTLDELWEWEKDNKFFESFSFYILRGLYYLKGIRKQTQKPISILAYCWNCNRNHLRINKNQLCNKCGFLICECGVCNRGCSGLDEH